MTPIEQRIIWALCLAIVLLPVLCGCTVVTTSDPEWAWPKEMNGNILLNENPNENPKEGKK